MICPWYASTLRLVGKRMLASVLEASLVDVPDPARILRSPISMHGPLGIGSPILLTGQVHPQL